MNYNKGKIFFPVYNYMTNYWVQIMQDLTENSILT